MAGLVHNAPVRSSRNCGTGGVSGSQRVPSKFGWIETGSLNEFFHDSGDITTVQSSRLNSAMAIDGTEEWTSIDGRLFKP
jgi:hypothetical protein